MTQNDMNAALSRRGRGKQNIPGDRNRRGNGSGVYGITGIFRRFRNWVHFERVTLLLVLAMIVGFCLILYPSVANYWNTMHQSRAIMTYQEDVSNIDTALYKEIIEAAEAYNARLAETGVNWSMTEADLEEYNSLLNATGSGIMAVINIPKIDVELPIYHGMDDAVLQTSIGHIEGTSLPVGGESSHCVLSGHRGLPSARLFTDLDQLTEGDTFTITVLNETLTYEVDQIRIVMPNDLSDLQIVKGRDLCTLVTCTPYGINTQRLLVRGHRIENANGDAEVMAEAIQIRPIYIAPFIMAGFLVIVILIFIFTDRHYRKMNRMKREYMASITDPGRPRSADASGPGENLKYSGTKKRSKP